MKLENQVCTSTQSIRLKELGVIQKSLFYHHKDFKRPVFGEYYTGKYDKHDMEIQVCNDKENAVSAYTVAELGIALPEEVKTTKHFGSKGMDMSDGLTGEYFSCESQYESTYSLYEAKAKASQLIYMLTHNLTTADEVNARLQAA